MGIKLGLSSTIELTVKNDTSSDIPPHYPVDMIGTTGMAMTEIGGHPESGSETAVFDLPSGPTAVMHVEAAVDGGTDFIGVTNKGIAAGDTGQVTVWGPVQAYVSNNTKPVAIGEIVCVGGASFFDDDTTIACGRAMEVGADNINDNTNLSWIFVNAIGRQGLGGG